MTDSSLELGGRALRIEDVALVARENAAVSIGAEARRRISQGRHAWKICWRAASAFTA